jgi:hypothetical protein
MLADVYLARNVETAGIFALNLNSQIGKYTVFEWCLEDGLALLPLFLCAVGPWSKLNYCVQRNFHPRRLVLWDIHEVCVNTTQDSLVSNDHDVFPTLHFHDNGLKTDNDIAVRFTTLVAVVVPRNITLA